MTDARDQAAIVDTQITTSADAHKFFDKWSVGISTSDDREQAWVDCAHATGQKVRSKEIGRAYAGDRLTEMAGERGVVGSLFPDDTVDEIQARIFAAFKGGDGEARALVNGQPVTIDKPPQPTSRFTPVAIDDVQASAGPVWLVSRLLPARGLACIVGPPKSGKSYMTTDMLFTAARGAPYADHATLAGPVFYLTGEGVMGFKRRLIAMRRHYKVEGQGVPFFMIENVPDLGSEQSDVGELLRELGQFIQEHNLQQPVAVVLDTLARCMGEGDENSARDMCRFVNRCAIIERHFECVVVVVHHTGKDSNRGARGSNALNGASDVTITVEKGEAYSTARVDEMKDGPEGREWRFRLVPYDLGETFATPAETSTETTSCVVELLSKPTLSKQAETKTRKPPKGVNGDLLKVIRRAIEDSGETNANHVRAVSRANLKNYCRTMDWQDIDGEPDSFRAALSRGQSTLRDAGWIGFDREWTWLV